MEDSMSATIERTIGQDRHLAELRAALTPTLRKQMQERAGNRLAAVFTLLRRLRPGDVRTAMLCHRALLIAAREDTRGIGFIDLPWADLPRLVYNVLDEWGYSWRDGHWRQDPPWGQLEREAPR
jgi:hypothetical protein